ncbi:MAG: phosphoribosylaminoimidazolesuccinocarboxamide synthase [Nitrospinota bacterium]
MVETAQPKEKPQKGKKLYEGKAKIVYATDDPNLVIQYFKDDASAFNAKKTGTIDQKGVMNNFIASRIFEVLTEHGIKTHFVEKLSDRGMLIKKVAIIPVEVVVRNRVAGSLAKRMGMPEGTDLKRTILEFYYKDDALDDPMINSDHIRAFSLATDEEIEQIREQAMKINSLLREMFKKAGVELIDFKLEFGRAGGKLLLADEISPDTCRLWDAKTGEKLDKDRFRFDLGKVEESYREIVKRMGGQ